jgi:hypothetical protein
MPGIVYRAVPTEVALMLPDDRIAAVSTGTEDSAKVGI